VRLVSLIAAGIVWLWLPLWASAGAADSTGSEAPPSAVTITVDPVTSHQSDPTTRYRGRLFRIQNPGGTDYTLSHNAHQRKQPDGTWKIVSSGVGMPAPSYANWYHGGFLQIKANGKTVQDVEPRVEVSESGSQGVLDFTWDHSLALVRVRFIAQPAGDHLLMEVRWEPKQPLNAFSIHLGCYPQGYAVAEPERLSDVKLQRCVTTPARDIPQVRTVTLDLPSDRWLLYHDRTLEKTRAGNSFSGPCGLMLLPEDVEQARLTVGGYQVDTVVDGRVKSGRMRLALFDFAGKRHAQAGKTITDSAAALLARMRTGSWLPAAIGRFDAAAQRRRVAALAKELSPKGAARTDALGRQIDLIETRRTGLAKAPRAIEAERNLRTALTQYRRQFWQAERPVRKTVRTLVFAGPFAYAWKLDAIARAAWGQDSVTCGYYIWKYWVGHRLSYSPATVEELLRYDVVVLADIPQDPFTPDKRQMLADYVKLGGGLLVLGGPYAYGAGAWSGSPLEPLLPVTIGHPFDLRPAGPNARLALTADGAKRLGPVSAPLGMVPWRNEVAPRAGAQIWLTAGPAPFAVYRRAGEGRVLAILGTAVGEAPSGETAFYDSPGWPELLKRMLVHLARGT